MLENYLPVFVFIIVGFLVGVGPMVIGFLLSPKKYNKEKLSAYECGFDPFENARNKFDVRFYLMAILFIVFDLEIAFLFPWAVILHDISLFGFFAMIIFLLELIIGYFFIWKKGALEWE
ncbi:MAG: NADH-quinone oxidoreductase subunit A [Candidatus Azosocius agrarius]|nr:MAG: NADH-quinone oxidoreductase subunit A [Gammaproteobacteria bacterium]